MGANVLSKMRSLVDPVIWSRLLVIHKVMLKALCEGKDLKSL